MKPFMPSNPRIFKLFKNVRQAILSLFYITALFAVAPAFGQGEIKAEQYFPVVKPKLAGLDGNKIQKIDSIAQKAIAQGATPGCVVLVARNGKVGFFKAYGHLNYTDNEQVKLNTVYDLASVTKISATTISVMKLYEEGKIQMDKTLGDYLPWTRNTDKAGLKIHDILLHQAGLVPFITFYKETLDSAGKPLLSIYHQVKSNKYPYRVAERLYLRKDWRDTLYKRILQSKLGPQHVYVYSDNDFILLGEIVKAVSGLPLEEYVVKNFYRPLGMASTSFKPREHGSLSMIAPTEREHDFRLQELKGDVHDPGASMFGGVAGHAGLFSNAYDLAKIYQLLLNGGQLNHIRLFKKETIDYFTAYQSDISRRGIGFDKPEKDNATNANPYPSLSASPQTFGHTGYTGICVWADPKYDLLYIFLSNRVNPDGGANNKLTSLKIRSDIQEIIYHSLL